MIPSRAKAAVKAMRHQVESLAHDDANEVVFDMSDPGTGKTFVRIMGFAKRRRKKGGKAMVFATKNTLRSAWADDFTKFAPDMKVVVCPAATRAESFATDADVYITNHDAVKWLLKITDKKFWAQFTELIVDESTAYKNHTSQRSRAMAKIARKFTRRACLSATPNSNGICDIWHQVYILDGGKRLGDSFYGFRNSVCVPHQVGRMAQAVNWVDKDGAEEAVFGLIADIVVRHKFEDCVDIPPTHQYTVGYDLTTKQRKAYETLEAAQLLVFDVTNKTKLTAINAAAVATKLLQVCSGAVYDNESKFHVVETERYGLIGDLVEARQHSLVFFQWQHQRDMLVEEAKKRGLTYCVLDGSAKENERTRMVTAYQRGEYRVMFAHPKSAAHGLTLTRGTATIWAGPTYDLELFQQGNKRQSRIGQKNKTEIIVVIAKNTIEEKVYEMLEGKNKRMTNLLQLFASLAEDARLAA